MRGQVRSCQGPSSSSSSLHQTHFGLTSKKNQPARLFFCIQMVEKSARLGSLGGRGGIFKTAEIAPILAHVGAVGSTSLDFLYIQLYQVHHQPPVPAPGLPAPGSSCMSTFVQSELSRWLHASCLYNLLLGLTEVPSLAGSPAPRSPCLEVST